MPSQSSNLSELGPDTEKKRKFATIACCGCKRRRRRCIPADDVAESACKQCYRRREPCVPQPNHHVPVQSLARIQTEETTDTSPRESRDSTLEKRISRIENLTNGFVAKDTTVPSPAPIKTEVIKTEEEETDTSPMESMESRDPTLEERISLAEDLVNGFVAKDATNCPALYGFHSDTVTHQVPSPSQTQGNHDTLSENTALQRLLHALPSEADIKILLREGIRTSRFTHYVNTQPHSKLTPQALSFGAAIPSAELSSFRPGTSMHPVVLARFMLSFVITLQGPSGEKIESLSEPKGVLTRRLLAAARTWVTASEEMHGSLDHVVCILLEAAYHVHCGNLRLAWAVYRRAMTAAQLLGLHRSPIPPIKRIDPGLDADPEFVWFRIVYMDRYLSLLLGLPQATADRSIEGVSTKLAQHAHDPPLGRFERALAVIASHILARNESPFSPSQMCTTLFIDAELLQLSSSMPPSFWRAPDFYNLKPGWSTSLLMTLRLGAHIYYDGLLIQLHLPYMVRMDPNAGAWHEYSKNKAINSSRQILGYFILHRGFDPMSLCSRPFDFFALLAAMTLLLAHLNGHHNREAISMLAQQRLSDRAMLDQVLEHMDASQPINMGSDVMSGKSAQLIRRLLEIEADAADGTVYKAETGEEGVDETELEGKGSLQLHIPHVGVIRISRQGPLISREVSTLPNGQLATRLQELPSTQRPDSSHDGAGLNDVSAFPPVTAAVDDCPLQGVDTAFFDGFMRGYINPYELQGT